MPMARGALAVAFLVSLVLHWGVLACPSLAGEAASSQATPVDPLVISLDDYDFSQTPGLLKRITSSPHGYFRFIGRPFAQAVCRRFEEDDDIMALVNLHGDAHLENYFVSDRQRGLADFDDATAGPFVLDLVRFGVSIHLASQAMGIDDQADTIVSTFFEGYRRGLQHGDLTIPEPALAARIRATFPRGRQETLARAEALMEPIATESKDFESATRQYLQQMRDENPHLPPDFFAIKAIGKFKLGIGSALSEKYLMRAEGPSEAPEDDLIIEAKGIRDLMGIDCVQRPRVEVGRIAIAQARLAFERPRYVGYVILHPNLGFERRKKFWVYAWDDNYTELSIPQSFETAQDLFDVARDVGAQLGRGHPKSIADPYESMLRRALLFEIDNLEADIMAAIRDLSRRTIAAWQQVRAQADVAEPTPPEK